MKNHFKIELLLVIFIQLFSAKSYGSFKISENFQCKPLNKTYFDSTNGSKNSENFEDQTFNIQRGEERIELYDLIQLFIPDAEHDNICDWNTEADLSKIVWDDRIDLKKVNWAESDGYEKYGLTDVTIGGKSFFYRRKREQPFTWQLCLSGIEAGYDQFWIWSGEEAHDYNTALEYLFPGRDYEAALYKECADPEGFKVYEITFPGKKKVWLKSEIEWGVSIKIRCIFSDKYLTDMTTCYR